MSLHLFHFCETHLLLHLSHLFFIIPLFFLGLNQYFPEKMIFRYQLLQYHQIHMLLLFSSFPQHIFHLLFLFMYIISTSIFLFPFVF